MTTRDSTAGSTGSEIKAPEKIDTAELEESLSTIEKILAELG